MYIRVVTFQLTIPASEYLALTQQIAGAFNEWPGLRAKYWLRDAEGGTYGGVYLFDSRECADASRGTDLFAAVLDNPAFADLTIREYDVLAGPTLVTTAGLVGVVP